MNTLEVLRAGVCLLFALQASDVAGGNPPETWRALQDAGMQALARHDYADAIHAFESGLALAATPDERGAALSSCGRALMLAGRTAEARPMLERALTALADAPADERLTTAGVLASVDRTLGDYRSAEAVLRAALATDDGNATGDANSRAILLINLADLLREQGRQDQALDVLREAGGLNGLYEALRVGVMSETADVYRALHRWSESIVLWNTLLETAEREHSVHLEAMATRGMGKTWLDQGNMVRAEPLLRRALQSMRSDPASSPVQVSEALADLAGLYAAENKLALAAESLNEAIAMDESESALGPAHPRVAALLEQRAMILAKRGSIAEAREDLAKAEAILTDRLGPNSPAVAAVHANLGDVERIAGRLDAAIAEYGIALRTLRAAGLDGFGLGVNVASRYADALKAAHRAGAVSSPTAFAARR